MGDREFEYEPNTKCDNCGAVGAFDIYGDYLCSDCLTPPQKVDEDTNCAMMQELWGGLECQE